jgi:hypothetical protein
VHADAASAARRWPAERFAAVAAAETRAGRRLARRRRRSPGPEHRRAIILGHDRPGRALQPAHSVRPVAGGSSRPGASAGAIDIMSYDDRTRVSSTEA